MFGSALAATEPLEPRARLGIQRVREPRALLLLVPRLLQVGEEGSGRALLHLLPGRTEDREVGRDQADDLAVAVLSGEALEQRVRVQSVPDRERPQLGIAAGSVPDEEAPRTTHGDEGGERVRQLALVGVAAGVEEVVPVEEVQRRLSHRGAAAPRTGGARPQR